MSRWRVAGAAIIAIVVLRAATACGDPDIGEEPRVVLPARGRPKDAASDAEENVLEPADAAPVDSGPPPDPFCLEQGLLLCFPFEDSAKNEVPGTAKLTPVSSFGVTFVDGKKKRAAHLETGASVKFDYAPPLEMKSATVEAFVNRDLVGIGLDTVFDNDQRFAMSIEADDSLRCNTAGAIVKGGKVAIETWVHVACVFDGTNIKAYVNGTEVATGLGTIGESATAGAAIGDNVPNGGESFAGEIDSLRVFTTARSAAEISAAAQN